MIWLATYADGKNMDYETFMYCDYMYKEEDRMFLDEIWEYYLELSEIGSIAFREKYEGIKMY